MPKDKYGFEQNPIQKIIKKKLNIIYLGFGASIWDWQLGGYRKETLNPLPSMLYTLKCIWKDNYSWNGGTWLEDPKANTQNITEDTKLNFLSKCIASWRLCFKPLLSKYGVGWSYKNGCGQGDNTHVRFKWWTLTHYRDHTEWTGDTHMHTWKDKKFLFSKKWKDYEHEYEIGDVYGCWEEQVSKEKYETSLEEKAGRFYNES